MGTHAYVSNNYEWIKIQTKGTEKRCYANIATAAKPFPYPSSLNRADAASHRTPEAVNKVPCAAWSNTHKSAHSNPVPIYCFCVWGICSPSLCISVCMPIPSHFHAVPSGQRRGSRLSCGGGERWPWHWVGLQREGLLLMTTERVIGRAGESDASHDLTPSAGSENTMYRTVLAWSNSTRLMY